MAPLDFDKNRDERSKIRQASFFAPYRVSIAGGGTDLPEYFEKEPGTVVSFALEHGIRATAVRGQMPEFFLQHSVVERVQSLEEIGHEFIREAIRFVGVKNPLQLSVLGDLPEGSGLGSSSALCVALIGALRSLEGHLIGSHDLAEQAYRLERLLLGRSVGKQDHYASAFRGFNTIHFDQKSVRVEAIDLQAPQLESFERHSLLFHSGKAREAGAVLKDVSQNVKNRMGYLRKMRLLALDLQAELLATRIEFKTIGDIIEENWALKRELSSSVSNRDIDCIHDAAMSAGAYGAKLLGAGTAGFVFVVAKPDFHTAIRSALGSLYEVPVIVDRTKRNAD
jgi:D-glycero-alpha-D-manno-heptose-7-phosphate kinase